MTEILRREIRLRCPPEQAFRAFTAHVDLWWPRGHRKFPDGTLRFTHDSLLDIAPDGSSWTMAEVRLTEPPHRLELDWFPGSPAAPTEVALAFEAVPEGTLVTIVHRAIAPSAREVWPERVAIFGRGWDAVLAAWTVHIEGDNRDQGNQGRPVAAQDAAGD